MRPGRIGVVVLEHGGRGATARAVASVLGQDAAPRAVVVVENGEEREGGPGLEEGAGTPAGGGVVSVLRLATNVGYGAGMNAGAAAARARGCDRVLLLNSDAVVAPGSLRILAEALEDGGLAAVSPVVVTPSGEAEAAGVAFDRGTGRMRLDGNGGAVEDSPGLRPAASVSGAAWMVSMDALARVGGLDEECFWSFEETDWSLRAAAAGLRVAVALGARAVHEGGATIGRTSPLRLFFAARNHLRVAARHGGGSLPLRAVRPALVVAMNLAHALRQRDVPRRAALRAVWQGASAHRRGVYGPAPAEPPWGRP